MNILNRIVAVTLMGLSTLPQRWGNALVIIAGTAGVVLVLVSMLALADGLESTIAAAGRPERAIVLNRGAQSEAASSIARDQVLTLLDLPGITKNTAGEALASAEAIGSLWLTRADADVPASVPLRGITPDSFALRPEITLVEGRMFDAGLRQLIVGRAAQQRYAGLEIGASVMAPDGQWEIVGVFNAGGSALESELWSDAESVMAAFHRNSFNAVTLWTGDEASFARLESAIAADPTLTLDLHRESDYYRDQSNGFSTFLAVLGRVIGGIMAVGAVFGALNAMYTAVSARSSEIATLQAIGFGSTGIVCSILVEAMLLALLGALAGAALAYLLFNGDSVSTVAGNNGYSQVVFALQIGPDAVMSGIVWSLATGLFGGLLPAIRAARLPLVAALRA